MIVPFYAPQRFYKSSGCSTSLLTFDVVGLVNFNHNCGRVIVFLFLICISLMNNEVENFSCAYWPFIYFVKFC